MSAIMIVYMRISDSSWIAPYFAEVPSLLEEYGAISIAGSREISRVEGSLPVPDRIAAFSFPSLDAIHRFLADERYQANKAARERGSNSEIFIFENAVTRGELV